jgi:hydroxymethylbilane synthase
LRAQRQDISFVDIRGNIDTRLRKHEEGQCDAIVLAAAGLKRLGLGDRITEFLELDICLPAAGQGALATECLTKEREIKGMLQAIDDAVIRSETSAERAFLQSLGGGCSVPIGVLAQTSGSSLRLIGCVAALDGSKVIRKEFSGNASEAERIGERLAQIILDAGAEPILRDLRLSIPNLISPP